MTLPNRHTRRAMGLKGPAYRNVSSDARPRFVRRHLKSVITSEMAGNRTRRVRKAVARMRREAVRLGLI